MSISRYLSQFADFLSSSGILGVSGGGTGLTSTPSNGQLDIGNGTGFTRATLTQGTGITVTNGAGSITIAATATGTVTSITAGTGLSGGTITTSGTIALVTTLGAVGTYAFLQYPNTGTFSPGNTTAGSNLKYAGASGGQNLNGSSSANTQTNNNATSPAGTWQCMGYSAYASGCSGSFYGTTLWVRIA